MKKISAVLLFFTFVFALTATAAVIPEDRAPVSLDVKKSKESLRPGETMTITLSNLRDESGRPADIQERVVVAAPAGTILGGTSVDHPVMPGQMAFTQSRSGTISFDFRAPLHCRKKTVSISVFNSLAFGPSDGIPLEKTEPNESVTTIKIPLICSTYLLMHCEEDYKRNMGKVKKNHHIHAILRLDCKPWIADNMMQVTGLSILEFSASATHESATETLSCSAETAETGPYNQLLLFHLDPETDAINGLIYEPVPLAINWHGDELPWPPPDKIEAGPVSVHRPDKKDTRRAAQDLSRNFPTEDRHARRLRRMQKTLTEQFSATRVHPDNLVKTGNRRTSFAGQGKWEKKHNNGFHRKTYRWELYLEE